MLMSHKKFVYFNFCSVSFCIIFLPDDEGKAIPLHAMEALGGRGYIAPNSFPTSALDGGEWSASRPGRAFTPEERTPGTQCTGGWVGPRAGLDTEARGKILCPCRWSNPDLTVVQPVVRHYTAWAIPAPCIIIIIIIMGIFLALDGLFCYEI
jgi:hypothetical protein